MGQGLPVQEIPPYFKHLHDLLESAIDREVINVNDLKMANAKNIYQDYTTTFPTPKIMYKYELPWSVVFERLWNPVLEPPVQSLMFLLVHNILPVRTRLFRLRMANDNKCLEDQLEEDVEHVFCKCVKSREGWQWVRWKITNELIPVNFPIPSDFDLINLCFESPFEKEIIWLVGMYIHYTWDFLQRSRGHINVDQMKVYLKHMYSRKEQNWCNYWVAMSKTRYILLD